MWLNEIYQHLNPIAIQIGPIAIRWYGIAYLAGFICAYLVIRSLNRRWELDIVEDDLLSIVIGVAFGVIIGARLFYILFYGAGYYLAHPASILAFNEGGMSFHGGLCGAIVGGWLVCRHLHISTLSVADMAVCGAPLGLFFGRTKQGDPKVEKNLKLAAELHDYFKENNGKNSLCCRVLTHGMDMSSGEHKEQCISFTGLVAEKLAQILVREFDLVNTDELLSVG